MIDNYAISNSYLTNNNNFNRNNKLQNVSKPFSSSKIDELQKLSPEEEKIVRELKKRDQEVRAHEQAHKTAGGAYAGAISFETTTGPDGKTYAIGGEVSIDTAPISNNPEATIQKMEIVARAALAPSQPSPQDIQIAAKAIQTKLQAQIEANKTPEENKNNPVYQQNKVASLTDIINNIENNSNNKKNFLDIQI